MSPAGSSSAQGEHLVNRFSGGPGHTHVDQAFAREPIGAGVLLFEVVGYMDGGGPNSVTRSGNRARHEL
ncbi:MAG TPA: hypothetical protein VGQ62_23670, partial [Chloroflexota bacterium]|nr:hypothetical protein [Chloroflexota bacterium]